MARKQLKSLAVFCGSSSGTNHIYRKSAEEIAEILIAANITLVYGGVDVGLMGVIANAILRHGGKVIGRVSHNSTCFAIRRL